mgnify:CR=1 FL=1
MRGSNIFPFSSIIIFLTSFTISFVHGLCTVEVRRALWASLLRDKPIHGPWLICGDFNVVVDVGKRKGGQPFCLFETFDFLDFMLQLNFLMLVCLVSLILGVIIALEGHGFGSVWIGFLSITNVLMLDLWFLFHIWLGM